MEEVTIVKMLRKTDQRKDVCGVICILSGKN